jgi:hypothetical protein
MVRMRLDRGRDALAGAPTRARRRRASSREQRGRPGSARPTPGSTSFMRSEALDEAVSVRADFHGGSVTPVAFRRRGREHRVARVNARWVDRAGKHPRFYFSVTDENGDVYQLQLQGGDLLWWLDTVTLEG